jgi:hypothetical protein
MKNRILVAIAAVFLMSVTSCAYKTCPTYSKVAKPASAKVAKA